MKLNQILINLEEYDALRDFKSNIEKGNTFYRKSYNRDGCIIENFITPDELKYKLSEFKGESDNKIKEKDAEISTLKNVNKIILDSREGILNQVRGVRGMSVLQFLKWRKAK